MADFGTADDAIRLPPIGGRPHPPVITALSVSADQTLLAAAGDDHAIRMIDTASRETVRVLTAHTDWVRDVHFAPDGRSLYSAGNDGLILRWNSDKGWAPTAMVPQAPPIACMCLCPSGERYAAVGLPPVALVGACASTAPRKVNLGARDSRCVRFSPDGLSLVVGGRDGTLRWIDPHSGEVVMEQSLHRGRIRAALFSRDGRRIVSVGEDGLVAMVHPTSGETLQRIELNGTKLLCLAELPDGKWVVGGTDNLIRILDVDAGTELGGLAGHTGSVAALAVSDTSLFSAGYDTTIRIWHLAQLPHHDSIARQRGSSDYIIE